MRALYEINADLEALLNNVDEETGELIIDDDALDALLMERTEKLEGVGLSVKNLDAEITAIKTEEKNLAERRKALEKKRDGRKEYLFRNLNGEKFETARLAISFRKSKAAEVTDETLFWATADPQYIRQFKPEINKDAIRKALIAGEEVPGAELVENTTISIK